MKCGRIGCNNEGRYQALVRIKASIVPADGKDVLAMVRLPFTVCMRCRIQTRQADIISVIPPKKMEAILADAKQKTGAAPNPARTDVLWVLIKGRRT